MKIAKIVPLFKNGNRKEFSNYRPGSILPQFSKQLEELFHNRLVSYIKRQKNIKDKFQKFKNVLLTENLSEMFLNASSYVDKKTLDKVLKNKARKYVLQRYLRVEGFISAEHTKEEWKRLKERYSMIKWITFRDNF